MVLLCSTPLQLFLVQIIECYLPVVKLTQTSSVRCRGVCNTPYPTRSLASNYVAHANWTDHLIGLFLSTAQPFSMSGAPGSPKNALR